MGIEYFLFLVVMVTFPTLSMQKLSGCNHDSNDVYILFEASKFSTQFLGGIDFYLQQIQGIAKDAVSTSKSSRVSLTAFTSQGPKEYVAINSGLTSSQVDSTIQTVSTTQLGGTISDALSYITNKDVVGTSNGNPVTLVVVFTSALKDTETVRYYLETLTDHQGVGVQVFPVGILAFNSASDLPFVKKIISNVMNFGQTVSDNVFQCNDGNTGGPDDMCSNWHGGETGLHPYEGRCDKFYQCSHQKAYAMQCPFGQLYDKEKMVCDHPQLVLQSVTSGCDYCQSSGTAVYPYSDSCELHYQCSIDDHGTTVLPQCCPPNQGFVEGLGCQPGTPCTPKNYTHHGSCRNYYRCIDGSLAMLCCPDGQAFDQYAGYCTSTANDCNTQCIGEKPVCNHKPNPDSICGYISIVHGREIPRLCPDKHAWDETVCDCTSLVIGAENCGVQPEDCDPDFVTDMDVGGMWGFSDNSGTWKYIGNDGVDFPGQYGVFKDGAYLTVYHFQNINWPKPVWARVTFQYSSDTSETEVLLSNGCYNSNQGQATIDMTVNPSTRTLRAGIRTNKTETSVSVQWEFNTSPDTWLQATMRYDGQNLDLNLKDTYVTSSTVSQSVQATGQIVKSPCALRIGRGNKGQQTFNGNIDEISIYSTCTYPYYVDY